VIYSQNRETEHIEPDGGANFFGYKNLSSGESEIYCLPVYQISQLENDITFLTTVRMPVLYNAKVNRGILQEMFLL